MAQFGIAAVARGVAYNRGAHAGVSYGHVRGRVPIVLIKENLAASLREEILAGRLAAGEPIVESKWSARLGVAQASVREAINILTAEGFVRKDAGRTARITLLSAEDVRQISEVRLPLELLAVRLAAVRRPDLGELEQIIHDMRSAIECRNARAVYERDLRFHLLLCEMSGNCYLAQHVRRLIVPVFAYRVVRANGGDVEPEVWREMMHGHSRVLSALRRGDPGEAEREMASSLMALSGTPQLLGAGA